jgi:hypothetical protein
MVIDFVFDKEITPWDTINLTIDDNITTVKLYVVSKNIRRLTLPDSNQEMRFEKPNIWANGIEEIIFSVDGVFNNVFHADRLPCSVCISVENNNKYKSINILDEATVVTDPKSQHRWKIAVCIQATIMVTLTLLIFALFSIILKKIWFLSTIVGLLFATVIVIFVKKKTNRLLTKINKN